MPPVLRLVEDILGDGAALRLPALPRVIFLVHGGATIDGRAFADGEAWHGEDQLSIVAGEAGATCWRWELLAPGSPTDAAGVPDVASREKLSGALASLPPGDPGSAVSLTAASGSTRMAVRPRTVRGAPGSKAGPIRCLPRPPTVRPASFG